MGILNCGSRVSIATAMVHEQYPPITKLAIKCRQSLLTKVDRDFSVLEHLGIMVYLNLE